VLKVGGSLLDLPELPGVVHRVLAQRPLASPLVVVGGGAAADVVREWDRVHQLGPAASHWLALAAMKLNEALFQQLMPEFRLVRSPRQFEQAQADGRPALLCADCFVRWGMSNHYPLAESWDVTSDTIAAWTARILKAQELVLVKSVDAPMHLSASEAAENGVVDTAFAPLVSGLPVVSWVNARLETSAIVPWLTGALPNS